MYPQSHPSWSSRKNGRIRLLKLGSAMLALSIGVYLLGISLWHGLEGVSQDEGAPLQGTRAEGVQLFGLDAEKNGFKVNAHKAIQDKDHEDIYHFKDVSADFQTESKENIQVKADTARLDKTKNHLFLTSNVHFIHDQGYDFTTSHATIDLKTQMVKGDDVVEGEGPAGHIHAQGFEIFDKGERVVFGKTIAHVREKDPS